MRVKEYSSKKQLPEGSCEFKSVDKTLGVFWFLQTTIFCIVDCSQPQKCANYNPISKENTPVGVFIPGFWDFNGVCLPEKRDHYNNTEKNFHLQASNTSHIVPYWIAIWNQTGRTQIYRALIRSNIFIINIIVYLSINNIVCKSVYFGLIFHTLFLLYFLH